MDSLRQSKRLLVFILGMHRSGTSALANILWNAGYYTGEENELIKPNIYNRDGYFERWPVVKTNDIILDLCGGAWDSPPDEGQIKRITIDPRIESLLAPYDAHPKAFIKDPRLCITLPVWERLLPEGTKMITVSRDIDAVAASLAKRDHFSREKALDLWRTYTERAANYSRNYPSWSLQYEDLFTEGRKGILQELSTFLETDLDLDEIAARVIDPVLQHNKAGVFTPKPSESAANDQQRLYERSQQSIGSGRRDEAIAILERLIGINPEHALALNDLGVLYFHKGQKETALMLLERSVQIDSRNATAQKNLAAIYQSLGRSDGAM